jgi:tetratricopeptide (TPR) repeat protein
MPTLLDLMGITSPKQIQGISLKPYILGQKKEDLDCYIETVYPFENFGWAPLEGFIHNKWKLIVAPKRELYDIKQDPEESKNVIAEKKEIFAQLNIKLDEYKAKISARAEARPKIPSFKEAEKLKSLGYIGGPFESKSAKPLADPKDKIDDYLLYFRANLMETQGNYEKAVEYYRQVLNLNPDSPWNYVNLGFVFMKMNRVKEAISLLEQAKERFPHSIVILSRLMSFYLHDEKWEEALSLGQAILDIDPYYFDALFLMGSTQAKLGHWQAARDLYEKALKIEPENKILRQRYAYSLMASGEYEAAKRAYDILLNEFPSDYSIMLELALLYKITGKYDEATKILERASRECPGPDTYYAYALHLIEIKRKKEAIDYLKKYLELSTAEDKSRRARARVLLDELTKEIK